MTSEDEDWQEETAYDRKADFWTSLGIIAVALAVCVVVYISSRYSGMP